MPSASEKFVTEFEDLISQRPYVAYGQEANRLQRQISEDRKRLKLAEHKYSLAMAEGAEPEFFSPKEIYDLVSNENFFKKVFKENTGKNPSQDDHLRFLQQISTKYPEFTSDEMKQERSPESGMEVLGRLLKSTNGLVRDQNNLKPLVDLIAQYPTITENSRGTISAAKRIQESGYKTNENVQDIQLMRNIANQHVNAVRESMGQDISLDTLGLAYSLSPERRQELGFGNLGVGNRAQVEELDTQIASQKKQREDAVEHRVKEDARLRNQFEELVPSTRRIAPLNKVHEQAEQLLNRGVGNNTLATARDKLAAAERMDVAAEIAPYLQRANRPTRESIQEFMTDYGPVIEGFRQEAAKDFLEHDLPKINSQFASKGAFFSGAREAALNKARADKEARIEREAAKLFAHGHEHAIKHHHMQREGTLKSAEIAGNARKSQKEALQHSANALRANAESEHGTNIQNVGALSNIARTQQEQAQHEIDVRMAEHREQQERPFVELARKSALAQGHQLPPFNFSPVGINPPPPNVFSAGAHLLGHAAGLHKMGYGGGEQYKKGGHVRNKYAKGGSIARHAAELQQMGNLMEGTPSSKIADESMREAQETRHHRIDPMGAYLMALSSHQMANPGKSMMQSFGEGSQMAFNAFNAAKNHNVDSKARYIKMTNAINQALMDQQQFLSKYHIQKSQQEETARAHNMQNAENARYHDMMFERQTEKPAKRSATEMNLEEEAKYKLLKSEKMKQELNYLSKLIKNTHTGPRWGFVKSHLPTTETDNEIRLLTNSIIIDMHQGMTNIPRSEAFLERLESTKPNIRNHYSANKLSVDIMNKGANDVNKSAISTLTSLGWTPKEIQAFLEEEKEKAKSEDTLSQDNHEPANDNEYTWMKFPGETKETEVANDDVAKALERGAKIV